MSGVNLVMFRVLNKDTNKYIYNYIYYRDILREALFS